MKEILLHKLHSYIKENNPDLLMQLEHEGVLTAYLYGKVNAVGDLVQRLQREQTPGYIIEELILDELTKELKPSKYNCIVNILETEFPLKHKQLQASGILKYEAVNLIAYCTGLFELFDFNEEDEDNRKLRYALTGAISEYFDGMQ